MSSRIVVLGDVVDSRRIDDRGSVRDALATTLEDINERFDGAVDTPLAGIKGVDESGGVLPDPVPLYDVVDHVRRGLHPKEARVVAAAGEIDVVPRSSDVSRMDGPAFHAADDLLTDIDGTRYRFAMDVGDDELDVVIADEVNLLLFRKREWTARQREVVNANRELGTQRAVAEELDVSQQAVSNVLARAGWRELSEMEDRLRAVLDGYG